MNERCRLEGEASDLGLKARTGRAKAADCGCSASPSREYEVAPATIDQAEWQLLLSLIIRGERDATTLTDRIFHRRHPARLGVALRDGEPGFQALHQEWLSIRRTLVMPALLPRLDRQFVIDGFAVDTPGVPAEKRALLGQLADRIAGSSPPVSVVRVVGHTDGSAKEAHNAGLGRARAEAVRDELAARLHAIGSSAAPKWIVESLGERQPIDSDQTAAGRARNRRVEAHLQLVSVSSKPAPLLDAIVRLERLLGAKKRIARVDRLLCYAKKLRSPNVDDRLIPWGNICPALSVLSPNGLCSEDRERNLQFFLKTPEDVDKYGIEPLSTIVRFRDRLANAHRVFTDDAEFLRHIEGLDFDVSQAIKGLDGIYYDWGKTTLLYYRALFEWILRRRKDPSSLYSCR